MQIYKFTNNIWQKIDISKIKKDDIIKVQKDNGLYLPNANNKLISLVIEDVELDDSGNYNVKSIPYPFKNEEINKINKNILTNKINKSNINIERSKK